LLRRLFALLVLVAFVLFVMAQTIRPSLQNRPARAEIQAPPEVRAILERRCYACHSDQARLSWFDYIAPGYWLVVHDVREARRHLNFDEIGAKPLAVQQAELYEAVNQVQLGAMPLASYRAVHPGAAMTQEELATLKAYLAPFAPAKEPTTPMAEMSTTSPVGSVRPSLNGVPYFSDYKNWRVVSTTDRGDNKTLRIITGNDVAIHAIETRQTNPWPDGTAFAKIALQAVDDGQGHIHAGKFVQVEFMVKDHRQYAKTVGWGFARWRGDDLKPYGENAQFAGECVGCHQPVRDNDYVYTLPIPREGGEMAGLPPVEGGKR
jgi:mono/diheme cytochrome c family protein